MTNMFLQRNKRKVVDYYQSTKEEIDFRKVDVMRRFISGEGKVLPRRRTGLSAKHQRKVTKAIKRARAIGLLPFKGQDF